MHLEYYKDVPDINKILIPAAPNLILAGNICYAKHSNFVPFFEKISKLYKSIYYILGNNEYYNNIENPLFSTNEIDMYVKESLSHLKNIFVLQNDFIVFDDFLIAGVTLWSYVSKKIVNRHTCLLPNDFIRCNNQLLINPKRTNKIHLKQRQWLTNILKGFPTKRKMIITHHMPSFKCLGPKQKFDLTNKYLFSNCDDLLNYCHIWCCGKRSMTKRINRCAIYMNSCGYLWENTNYQKNYTFYI